MALTPAPDDRARRNRRRARFDVLTTVLVRAGGGGILLLVGGLLGYLGWVAAPLFAGADLAPAPEAGASIATGDAVHLVDVDDSGEIVSVFAADGRVHFVDRSDGRALGVRDLSLDAPLRSAARTSPDASIYALELADGRLHFVTLEFPVSFASGERERSIDLRPAFGPEPIDAAARLDVPADSVVAHAVHYREPVLTIALADDAGAVHVLRLPEADPGLPLLPIAERGVVRLPAPARSLHLASSQWLWAVAADDAVSAVEVRFADDPRLRATRRPDAPITAVAPLLGGASLLVGDDAGLVRHWFPLREDDDVWRLVEPRRFDLGAPVRELRAESRRRGFLALGDEGRLGLFHTTAEARLLVTDVDLDVAAIEAFALSASADALFVLTDGGGLHVWRIDNEHPEASASALFAPVWYEGYGEPIHSWQSSAASTDFEPKFGLAPLAWGTLKASLYAMLFAIPIGLLAALHTAYYMHPRLRSWVKPSIELMAALPTVILGFLAGLWLAPLIEARLAGFLTGVLVVPLGVLAAAPLLRGLPATLRTRIPAGTEALLLVPWVLALVAASGALGPALERLWFDGDLRGWLGAEAGLGYDQRNAIVVGVAMGFAVTPIIYTIAEDAIHSVPPRLVQGALALGADRWQTLSRLVLPTASPAIFSALMIGFGRAVGETMIVLMASGNTPIMEANPFSGMRSFAANIAVELPESEVGSTHYRILFLAALVLFLLTFVVNSAAEAVRARLRARYGSL